jgi:hypothetical protein
MIVVGGGGGGMVVPLPVVISSVGIIICETIYTMDY